jgi:hypothetical protein
MMFKKLLLVALVVGLVLVVQGAAFAVQDQIGFSVINMGTPAFPDFDNVRGPNDPGGLLVAPTGTFNINNTVGIINKDGTGSTTSYAAVRGNLWYALNAASPLFDTTPPPAPWNGKGLGSNTVKQTPYTTLGIITGSDYNVLNGSYVVYGETLKPTSILVGYTWAGNATMNGMLTPADYGAIDDQFNGFGYALPALWAQGDYDHDGILTPGDYGAIDDTFNVVGYGVSIVRRGDLPPPHGVGAVPEPGTIALLVAGALTGLLFWKKQR